MKPTETRPADNELSGPFERSVEASSRRDDAAPIHGFALAILISAALYAVLVALLLIVW